MYCLEPLHRGRHSVMRCIPDQRRAVDRKNSEQAITYELQYLPTMCMDRVRLRIEQRVEYREIQLAVGDVDSAPQRFTALYDPQDRVIVISDHVEDFVLDEGLHCLSGVAPPYQRGPEKLRVQHAAMHGQSCKRKACREH